SSRRRHTRCYRDWSSDVCSSDLGEAAMASIRYWTNSAGGWSVTTIDAAGRGASIAIDGSDHIHAAYLGTNGSTTELRHATDAGRSEERRVGKGGSGCATTGANNR